MWPSLDGLSFCASEFDSLSLDEIAFFLEHDRAGSLLEALGGRSSVGEIVLPPELKGGLDLAHAREAAAVRIHDEALRRGRREEIRRARERIREAREGVEEAVARIERLARNRADLLFPEPPSIEAIQASLAEN